MYARSAVRAQNMISRRGFHSTRANLGSGFHYPEGPRSSIPFNPLTKHFAWRYWGFMTVGFFIPFGIAFYQTKKHQA